MHESQAKVLQMVPELLILLPAQPLAAQNLEVSREELLINSINKGYEAWAQYQENHNTQNNSEANADAQNDDSSYWLYLWQQDQTIELLLDKGDEICDSLEWAHGFGISKQIALETIFDSLTKISAMFGDKAPVSTLFHVYINSLLESYNL